MGQGRVVGQGRIVRPRRDRGPGRHPWLVGTLLVVLAAAGCGGNDEADGAEASPSVSGTAIGATTAPTATEAPTPAATDAPSEATTDEAPAASGGDAGCLVGTWSLRGESFAEQMTAAFDDETPGEAEFVGGEFLVDMRDDGTFTATREGWSIRLVMPEGTFRMTFTGTETGTWAVTDAGLDVTNDPTSDPDVEFALENPDGTLTPFPSTGAAPNPAMNEQINALRSDLTVDCDGDVLTLTDDEFGFLSVLDRR